MRDSGYIVEHYTMIHSKWSDENPVYGQRCSSIRIYGSVGFWFSANCTEELPCICMAGDNEFGLPTITLAATTSTVIKNATELSGLLHGKYIYYYYNLIQFEIKVHVCKELEYCRMMCFMPNKIR